MNRSTINGLASTQFIPRRRLVASLAVTLRNRRHGIP